MDREWELWELQTKEMVSADRVMEFRDANVVENPINRLRLSVDFYFPELSSHVMDMEKCIEYFSALLESNDSDEAMAQYQKLKDIRASFIYSIKPLVAKYL
jgi:hypothetical protein